MKFKIHRGTQEIGGSCVEVWTDKTKIIVDIGMPLVERDGKEFDFKKYKDLSTDELIKKDVLPDVSGIYKNSKQLIDGVLISHAHLDHYGFANLLHQNIQYYLSAGTHKLIEISNVFIGKQIAIKNYSTFKSGKTFTIGDISVTPYLVDHSAFDAYSFLIEANGKKLFYSGDFRAHGRKGDVFKWFTHNAPKNVDYLLMEGTQVGRATQSNKTETAIENELVKLFKATSGINLIYASGQNIDRIVSAHRACIKEGKLFVVDVYIANVLKALSSISGIPFPSAKYKNIRVMYPKYITNKLMKSENKNLAYQFASFKIKPDEISENANNIMMCVRPSMKIDLDKMKNIDGGNLIFSMWDGYFDTPQTKVFIDYLKNRKFAIHKIHTSGHADLDTLKKMVASIKPKQLVPIHTFKGKDYKTIFNVPVLELQDKQVVNC